MGDINIDNINPHRITSKLMETLALHNLTSIYLPTTRVTPHSETSTDCICTNMELTNCNNHWVLRPYSPNVHNSNYRTTPKNSDVSQTLKNVIVLTALLQQENWQSVLDVPSLEGAYNIFNTTLSLALNKACPKIKKILKQDLIKL